MTLEFCLSNETNLLLICHCERDEANTVRVISARKATKNEQNATSEGINYER
jgi:uncharacterized DUF497 family protein|tara:strand:- start:778 stop:933 length:156 start_codon:yes stop_codon:yes gene_type:complete